MAQEDRRTAGTDRSRARSVGLALVGCLLLVGQPSVHAAEDLGGGPGRKADSWSFEEPEFLPVDEAFLLTAETGPDGALLVRWDIADGYYLYRHRFNFATRVDAQHPDSPVTLGEAEIPPGERKVDDYFGEVEVYYGTAQARVPVVRGAGPVEVGIGYQGCADAGLCYPPETRWVALTLGRAGDAGPESFADGVPAPVTGVPQTEDRSLAASLAGVVR